MNAIWVANKNKNNNFILSKVEVLCTVSCLSFIKHYYPDFKTIFFVDNYTKEYYNQFGILDLFDEVNDTLLDRETNINSDIFWASGKLLAQRSVQGPIVTIDLDFRLFSDIKEMGFFDADISCLWLETDEGKYSVFDRYLRPEKALENTNLVYDFDWDSKALNVSILHLKNDDFKNIYCDLSIEYMTEASKHLKGEYTKFEKDGYIMFCEQYMLHELAKKYNQKIKTIIKDYQVGELPSYISSIGVEYMLAGMHINHYASGKPELRTRGELCKNELNHMYSVTNNITTNKRYLDIFNKIFKMSDDERCFC